MTSSAGRRRSTTTIRSRPLPASPGAFRGFVLAINCRDAAEVDRIYGELNKIDGVSTVPSIREVD